VTGFFTTIPGMGRPRKFGSLPLDSDLRIPVTSEQRAVIVEATRDVPEGMAGWARELLLAAAKRRLAKNKDRKKKDA
jgi:hypothetical protein